LTAPTGDLGECTDIPPGSDGDLTALAATVAGNLDETPRPPGTVRPRRRAAARAQQLRIAILVAVGIMGSLIGAAAALALLGK
jgi:hypothetical protein